MHNANIIMYGRSCKSLYSHANESLSLWIATINQICGVRWEPLSQQRWELYNISMDMNSPRALVSRSCNAIDISYYPSVNTALIIIAHIFVLTIFKKVYDKMNNGMGFDVMLDYMLYREYRAKFPTYVLKYRHYYLYIKMCSFYIHIKICMSVCGGFRL